MKNSPVFEPTLVGGFFMASVACLPDSINHASTPKEQNHMAWTFKDRYKPNRMITVDDDIPERLQGLEDTFDAFRAHNALDLAARKQQLLDEGCEFAKAILIHTQISYCLGTYDCEEDVYFDYYCDAVRKHLINVHPVFAMRKYAEFMAFIKNQNESIEACQFLKEHVDKCPDDV